MTFEKIYKRSLKYTLLKAYGRFLHHYIFYNKVHVNGLENIPKKTPLIMTANHQNALMDALAIIFAADHQPVFLARSDIFSKPFLARVMRSFKIMPVYRIRDGMETLGKNQEIFNQSVNVLRNGKRLAIMPEGNHGGRKKLRPLKKGVARIAFRAEEMNDFKLGLHILPIGIDYSNYTNFRNSVFINIGKPFSLSEFFTSYQENQQKALLQFNAKLKSELSKLMIDIQNDAYYDTYYNIREIYNARMRERQGLKKNNLRNRFFASKSIIAMIDRISAQQPGLLDWFREKVDQLYAGLATFSIRYWVIEKKKYSYLLLIFESLMQLIFSPVHLYGMITNYLPYKIPVWLTDKVKDKQFVSSIKYVILLIIFLFFYAVEYLVFSFFTDSVWIRNIFLLSLPLAGYFTIENWILFKKLKARWVYNIAISSGNSNMRKLLELRAEIINKLDTLNTE